MRLILLVVVFSPVLRVVFLLPLLLVELGRASLVHHLLVRKVVVGSTRIVLAVQTRSHGRHPALALLLQCPSATVRPQPLLCMLTFFRARLPALVAKKPLTSSSASASSHSSPRSGCRASALSRSTSSGASTYGGAESTRYLSSSAASHPSSALCGSASAVSLRSEVSTNRPAFPCSSFFPNPLTEGLVSCAAGNDVVSAASEVCCGRGGTRMALLDCSGVSLRGTGANDATKAALGRDFGLAPPVRRGANRSEADQPALPADCRPHHKESKCSVSEHRCSTQWPCESLLARSPPSARVMRNIRVRGEKYLKAWTTSRLPSRL